MRHIAIFSWKEGLTQAQKDAFYKGMRESLGRIPVVTDVAFYDEIGEVSRFTNAMEVVLARAEDWRAYCEDDLHDIAVKLWNDHVAQWEEVNLQKKSFGAIR